MANNYSAADKRVFRLKDYLNSRMSSLKAASVIHEGDGSTPKDVLKDANEYFEYLFQEQDKLKTEPAKQAVLPTPTQAQQKILEAIAHEIGVEVNDDLKLKVLTWAFKAHNIRKFPESQGSIPEIVKYLGE